MSENELNELLKIAEKSKDPNDIEKARTFIENQMREKYNEDKSIYDYFNVKLNYDRDTFTKSSYDTTYVTTETGWQEFDNTNSVPLSWKKIYFVNYISHETVVDNKPIKIENATKHLISLEEDALVKLIYEAPAEEIEVEDPKELLMDIKRAQIRLKKYNGLVYIISSVLQSNLLISKRRDKDEIMRSGTFLYPLGIDNSTCYVINPEDVIILEKGAFDVELSLETCNDRWAVSVRKYIVPLISNTSSIKRIRY